jgi:hypothetical protein
MRKNVWRIDGRGANAVDGQVVWAPKQIRLEYDNISFGHRSGSYAFFLECIRIIPGFELRHAFVGTFPGNASTPDTQDL